MNIGKQLQAPEGFKNLEKCRRYYFLCSDPDTKLTTLATFSDQAKGYRVQIHRLLTVEFQQAIDRSLIVEHNEPVSLPPWLKRKEGRNVRLDDAERIDPARTHTSEAEHRYAIIEPLIASAREIFRASNPFSPLNLHAKYSKPVQNRKRIVEWFFAYMCHGQQLAALWTEHDNIGCYDKADPKYNETHYGKVSIAKGRHFGWPSAMFAEQIIESVTARLGTKWTKHLIYVDSLEKDFGCQSRMDERGKWELVHPDGEPFPDTEGKFWYQWFKQLDLRSTNIALYGEHHVRSNSGTKGSYTQHVSSILSEFEVDAFHLKERPRLSDGEGSADSLCVVRGICVGSKYIVGVGFSLGGEDGDGYQMMLFCCAIGLVAFAELWGLGPKSLLPARLKGLPSHLISDRGSAPLSAIISKLKQKFPVRELTEAYSGQSKPNVESGHPRTRKIEGPPTYTISDKDVVGLIQREVCRVSRDNHVRNVGSLVVGQRAVEEVVNSPYALAEYLDSQGLNDGIEVTNEAAVRKFLWNAEFELRDGGFWLESRCYSCSELDASDLYPSLSPGQSIPKSGYHLKLNLMWAWVEYKGRLYKLKQKLAVRLGESEMMMSLSEIQCEAKIKRELSAEQPQSATAAELEAIRRFETTTGLKWGGAERKPGRVCKTTDAAIEKQVLTGKPRRPREIRKRAA